MSVDRWTRLSTLLLVGLSIASPRAWATECGGSGLKYDESGDSSTSSDKCGNNTYYCKKPIPGGVTYTFLNGGCNPLSSSCGMQATIPVEFPGNHLDNFNFYSFGLLRLLGPTGLLGYCGDATSSIRKDLGVATVTTSVECANSSSHKLQLELTMCPSLSCSMVETVDLDFGAAAGCPVPLPNTCGEGSGGSSGAAGTSCPLCQPVGGDSGCSTPVGGGGPSCEPAWLGKSRLRYAAGGAGGAGLPGATAWRASLGLYWSHDYAERIVADPDNTHVWLLTRHGSFREFSNLAAGTGLRLYQGRSPSDEFRKLYFDTASGGWELQTLDGRKDIFRSDGQWLRTVFASDPSHPVQGSYNVSNQLISVSFPDGRSDTFTYYAGGKLASITEEPVVGSGTLPRSWTFTWSGDELTYATRPDGTAWRFYYDAARPGYLTRMDLVSGPLGRVAAAFEYQAGTNNVAKSWRGDPSFNGPAAVDKVTYGYTNPARPTQTVVTRAVSGTFDQVTTITLGRDPSSGKPKPLSIQGSCPTCGLSPTTSFAYTGSPLLPTSTTDAKNTRTEFTYDVNGRMLTRTDAANVPLLTRTTVYTYDASFPGLVTQVEVPSTSGGTNKRRTGSTYDATTGVRTARTIDGFESGAALPAGFKSTGYTHNGSGEVLTIDPPGHGSNDATTFTYNLAGRNGHVADTRTDPLVGATTFGYDGFNRRTSVTDPNNVQTVTSYDSLNRVTEVRQKGATTPEDLVTTYTYSALGDLFCTKLPRGNGIEYTYDAAGRLIAVTRGTAVATPTATSCLDAAQPRERMAYKLDGIGNRVEESRERWTGSAWESRSKTAYVRTCHLDKSIQGDGSATPSVTEYCYDLNDNLEKVWDANHPKASNPDPTQLYTYDTLNRLETVTVAPNRPAAATTRYGYDVQDHLASVTDAENNVTTYTYSDRDLLTQEVSPVSGTTIHTYDEHGELATTTDARAIVTTRMVDDLDRVTSVVYSDGTPGTGYAYDVGTFGKGRLSSITRSGQAVGYAYDRFGRQLQDGALGYGYDANGNRTRTTYPNGVAALYTHDFADREATLTYEQGGSAQLPAVVSGAVYEPFGPLSSLTLGNGLVETRLFDARYFPDRIQVPGRLDWDYTVDAMGNPLQVNDLLVPAQSRTYGYKDYQYFLTQGDGPWGTRSWTYDRIGNRLSETRSGVTDTYGYTGGNPKLQTVAQGGGAGTKYLAYDPAGNQIQDSRLHSELQLSYDAAGRMTRLEEATTETETLLLYDGRGYLREARQDLDLCSPLVTQATYSSEGVLLHRAHRNALAPAAGVTDEAYVFYFAGRSVALLEGVLPAALSRKYLTVDHLGTPVLATSGVAVTLWAGGFEPFGADWSGAEAVGMFLRFPGQWEDEGFGALYYNVYRWSEYSVGRYSQSDPLDSYAARNVYLYADGRPTSLVDPSGLSPIGPTDSQCCSLAASRGLFNHGDSGTVVCCQGRKVPCITHKITSNYPSELVLRIKRTCIIEHENSHVPDVVCDPKCEIAVAPFPDVATQRNSECSAYRKEIRCLKRNRSACGVDGQCRKEIDSDIKGAEFMWRYFGGEQQCGAP